MVRSATEKDGQDFFPTPEWATDILTKYVAFSGPIWECACGNGKMAKELKVQTGQPIICTDLYDQGFGTVGVDFLEVNKLPAPNIVTNPPYNLLNQFILHGLELGPKKLCLLIRTLSLESKARYEIFKAHPPSKVIVITDRVDFANPDKPGGAWSLSWFVWEQDYAGPTILEFSSIREVRP